MKILATTGDYPLKDDFHGDVIITPGKNKNTYKYDDGQIKVREIGEVKYIRDYNQEDI